MEGSALENDERASGMRSPQAGPHGHGQKNQKSLSRLVLARHDGGHLKTSEHM